MQRQNTKALKVVTSKKLTMEQAMMLISAVASDKNAALRAIHNKIMEHNKNNEEFIEVAAAHMDNSAIDDKKGVVFAKTLNRNFDKANFRLRVVYIPEKKVFVTLPVAKFNELFPKRNVN